MDAIRQRLAKILMLAKRGVGGEKKNAENILRRELQKYGLTIDDIDSPHTFSKPVWREYRYKTVEESRLLMQCLSSIVNLKKINVYKRRKKRELLLELSTLDHMELESMFVYYRRLYAHEKDVLFKAFMQKHALYPRDSEDDGQEMSREEIRQLVDVMNSLKQSNYVSTRRQLEAKKC
ncbi:MAG TPA: hypothetical protein PKB02_02525 [Anaerohalosphaeraceae bacterium]|nr:hypothetical protein [Anaerohalosphaeraceae bacterium]